MLREPQRRHRWLTVPSGWLLFVCVFLPAWRPCSHGAALPLAVMPFAWPPYLAALLIALVAMARTRAEIERRGVMLLSMIRFTAIAVAGFALVALAEDGFAIGTVVAVKIGTVVALLVPWRGTERAIAVTSTAAATATAAFTLGLALSPEAAWGAPIGAVAACALLLGCVGWTLEVVLADLCGARMVRRSMRELRNRRGRADLR